MKERSILFNGEMVKAILDGRKTQTRRVLTPRTGYFSTAPADYWQHADWSKVYRDPGFGDGEYLHVSAHDVPNCARCNIMDWHQTQHRLRCRWAPGDRLWVRETWGLTARVPLSAHEQAQRDRWAPKEWLGYKANWEGGGFCWKSGRFMPRWASRLTLEVTEVRVQRVQEISEEDVEAEGIDGRGWADMAYQGGVWTDERNPNFDATRAVRGARGAFASGWDSINAKRGHSWESNPWVWAVTFRRVES